MSLASFGSLGNKGPHDSRSKINVEVMAPMTPCLINAYRLHIGRAAKEPSCLRASSGSAR